jgi:hypothetical protein
LTVLPIHTFDYLWNVPVLIIIGFLLATPRYYFEQSPTFSNIPATTPVSPIQSAQAEPRKRYRKVSDIHPSVEPTSTTSIPTSTQIAMVHQNPTSLVSASLHTTHLFVFRNHSTEAGNITTISGEI